MERICHQFSAGVMGRAGDGSPALIPHHAVRRGRRRSGRSSSVAGAWGPPPLQMRRTPPLRLRAQDGHGNVRLPRLWLDGDGCVNGFFHPVFPLPTGYRYATVLPHDRLAHRLARTCRDPIRTNPRAARLAGGTGWPEHQRPRTQRCPRPRRPCPVGRRRHRRARRTSRPDITWLRPDTELGLTDEDLAVIAAWADRVAPLRAV